MFTMGPYNASFGATTFFTAPPTVYDHVFSYIVRCTTPALLSTVIIAVSWVDDNGVTQSFVAPSLALANLTSQQERAFPMRVGANQNVTVSAILVGTGQFEFCWGTVLN